LQRSHEIEKRVFTDPDRQTLFIRTIFTAKTDNITPYILINPHMKNTGNGDVAYVSSDYLNAREGSDKFLSLKIKSSSPKVKFIKTSAGFVGSSDGWTDLSDNQPQDWSNPQPRSRLIQPRQISVEGLAVLYAGIVGFGWLSQISGRVTKQ
jgi:GH15 family glucan-1,4-alpha-glucosidase